MAASKNLAVKDVTRSQFTDLVARSLAPRWLAEERVIFASLTKLTASRALWVGKLATAIHMEFCRRGHASRGELAIWLLRQPAMRQAFRGRKTIRIRVAASNAILQPAYRWPVPQASTHEQLADLLCLRSSSILDWLLLPHVRRNTRVDHYTRRMLSRPGGSGRLIEEPRLVMKRVQNCIAKQILVHVPVHDAAHAYRPGRSIRTCALPHVGKHVVLKMDLQDFFGSISRRRVSALFRLCGYNRPISLSLGRLSTAPPTNASFGDEPDFSISQLAARRTHLPQGSQTSPAIANAVVFQMDRRLAGLASSVGAVYTRYADDLFFSGDASFGSRIDRFSASVAVIAMEEGFAINHRKTRKMFHGHRQRILGLTVNRRMNTDRKRFEELKAILTNCQRHGWRSQNREQRPHFDQYLRGHIAAITQINSSRGQRLRELFESVDWS
ncbi:MAG: reverse transcriptase family protein [Pirellulaceae bacterium]